MADDIKQNTEETKENTQATNENTQAQNLNTDAERKNSEAVRNSNEQKKQSNSLFKEQLTLAGALSKGFDSLFQITNVLSKKYEQLGEKQVGVAISTLMLFKNVDAMNSVMQNYGQTTDKTTDNVNKFYRALGAELGPLGRVIQNLSQGAANAIGFENSLIEAAAAGGNFAELMNRNGQLFGEGFDAVMHQVGKDALDTANFLGISFEESIKRSHAAISTFPGEINKLYSGIKVSTKDATAELSLGVVELNSLIAKGTGQSIDAVNKSARSMIGTFAINAKEAAERISIISDAAKEAKIPLDVMQSVAQNLDNTFSMYGDNLLGTTKLLENVRSGLKDSNLGFEGQLKILQTLTGSIQNMSFATRAFIGLQGGLGKSMIGSGLQVEKMLKEGKISEVADLMQKTIEQKTGGRVISFDEATSNSALESQFMKQREMMKSMFGIGEQEATRLMDVMSKGRIGTGANKDVEDILSKTLSQGKQLSERQYSASELQPMNNYEFAKYENDLLRYSQKRDVLNNPEFNQNIMGYSTQQIQNRRRGNETIAEQASKVDYRTEIQEGIAKGAASTVNSFLNMFGASTNNLIKSTPMLEEYLDNIEGERKEAMTKQENDLLGKLKAAKTPQEKENLQKQLNGLYENYASEPYNIVKNKLGLTDNSIGKMSGMAFYNNDLAPRVSEEAQMFDPRKNFSIPKQEVELKAQPIDVNLNINIDGTTTTETIQANLIKTAKMATGK